MTTVAAIRINDDLSSGQATISNGAADNEAAGWVNKVLSLIG